MKVKIHIAKPFFKEVEQKEYQKFEYDKDGNKRDGKWKWVIKPKNSKCITTTLAFDNIESHNIEKVISNVRDTYGIKLNKKKEMVFVQPNTTKSLPKLSNTLQKFCDRMKKQAEEYV